MRRSLRMVALCAHVGKNTPSRELFPVSKPKNSSWGFICGLEISIRESGDVTILDLRGRATINDGESELLKRQLQELIAKGVDKFLLNLAGLYQVDSSGLSMIAKTCARLRDHIDLPALP